ncbi:MAG: Nif11-like leader peptide family natural product precursor [Ruminococcus sp.]|nr:Nif11-like leader peptide family natural product precursor [Ruminococcus sp.]
MIEWELERLLQNAKADASLKQALLQTREDENPVEAFCALCRRLGYDVTAGELWTVGMTASDAKLRSVNGGGVNAIDGWDDAYEQFFSTLIWT